MNSFDRTRLVRRTVSRCWPILALPLLNACASDPEVRVVTRTEVVEVQVEVYGELPASLTEPLVYPEPLPERFTENDLWESWVRALDIIDRANEDRASAARIASGAE